MIKNSESLSMAEASEYINDTEKNTEIIAFIKKFNELSTKDAKQLREKLRNLNLMKIREEHISKIIDVLPEDAPDLNKIFVDVSLEEDETKKILDTVKEFK